jgi:hypothetical protein
MAIITQAKPLNKRETSNLIGSDKVEGTPACRTNGDRVGRQPMGPAQRICLGAGGRRRLGRRSALRGGHAVHQECRRPLGLLARALARFRFWRRRRAHHDARLRSSGHRRDLSTLCRHRRFGVFRWGIGDDGSFVQQYRRRPRSFWRRITSRRQRWISEIHPHLDLESVLSGTRTLQSGLMSFGRQAHKGRMIHGACAARSQPSCQSRPR